MPPLSNDQLVELLQKAQITTGVGGQQSAKDTQKFIDMSIDQTAVLKKLRTETGIVSSLNLDAIELGDPAMVAATEATAPASDDVVSPSIARKVLQPVEVIMAYDISFDMLRKNIEGQNINNTLNQIFSKRFGKDTVIAAFNGDTSLDSSSRLNKCKRIIDGFIKQAGADTTVHDVAIGTGTDYLGTIFPKMLQALPKDFKDDRSVLGLFVSADVAEAYAQQIGGRETAYGDQVLTRIPIPTFRGIEVIPVYGMADTSMILTPLRNLAVGYGQNMTVGRDIYNRRRIVEVTITGSLDVKLTVGDAFVLGS